jgi:tetratricopeptide (TPR) repeat protein
MKLTPLAIVLAAMPCAAAASVIAVGGGNARACYEAAEAQNITAHSLNICDRALAEEALVANDRAATLVNRGIIRMRRGSLAQAEADFDAALVLNSAESEAWLNKAVLYARYRDSRDALPFVAKALELGTRHPEIAYFVRAMAYEDSGNIPAAYRDFQRARNLAPKWHEPAAELARFQLRRP